MIVGKLLFGFILGNIASTLANAEAQKVQYYQKLDAVKVRDTDTYRVILYLDHAPWYKITKKSKTIYWPTQNYTAALFYIRYTASELRVTTLGLTIGVPNTVVPLLKGTVCREDPPSRKDTNSWAQVLWMHVMLPLTTRPL